jgi:WhiB family redox-sensing transcriptional regulator
MSDWRKKAACRSADPEMWFPASSNADTSAARAACTKCPVRWRCGAEALASGQTDGIWAGFWLTRSYERDALAEALPDVPVAVPAGVCRSCGVEYEPTASDTGRCYGCLRGMVSAAAVRDHLRELKAAGWTWRQISRASGISQEFLLSLMKKSRSYRYTRRETAEAILAVPLSSGVLV